MHNNSKNALQSVKMPFGSGVIGAWNNGREMGWAGARIAKNVKKIVPNVLHQSINHYICTNFLKTLRIIEWIN